MKITWKPEQEKFIQAQIASGKYASVDELVNTAIHLLEKREEQIEELRLSSSKQLIISIAISIDIIKISDLAKLLDISQYYFCRLFRESTGVAPYRYVIQQRISKVKALIKENKLSLSDIALECGFSSQSQMTHHFGKLVGVTPKTYRDRL